MSSILVNGTCSIVFVDGFMLTCALFGLGSDHYLLILMGCGSH